MRHQIQTFIVMFWLSLNPLTGYAIEHGLFSEQELAWMSEHPVIRIGVEPDWKPVEFIDEGVYKGFSAEYINVVAQKTGLQFVLVPEIRWDNVLDQLDDHSVDLLPVVIKGFTPPTIDQRVVLSPSYHVGTTVVVTRFDGPIIFNPEKLFGKSVALKGGGSHQKVLQTHYPEIRIISFPNDEAALAAVAAGQVDAAIGTDIAVLPFLSRKYHHILHISGVISNMNADLAMGVRKDLPILASIIQKALDSITVQEAKHIAKRWLEGIDYGVLSLPVMMRYYALEVVFLLGGVLSIILFLYRRTYVERRRALKSEHDKAMFLAVMSHEIRSPMNAILAAVELLQCTSLNKKQQHLTDVATSGAETLLRLLDNVLDLSKCEKEQLQLEIVPTRVEELARHIVELLRIKAHKKNLDIDLTVSVQDTALALIDPTRISQILHNLVSNAVKFTEQGGIKVDIKLTSAQDGDVQQGELCIAVSDTGIGISREQQSRLFKPFTQVDESMARRFGGSGLGLSISYELVSLMHGTIDVESEIGKGTTFTVVIPVQMQLDDELQYNTELQAIDTVIHANNADHDAVRLHVLVIDDQQANRFVIRQQLQQLGCVVTTAENGETGWQVLSQSSFDLILLDCLLPDVDGYHVASSWRQHERRYELAVTPIIAISAAVDMAHQARCIDAGMDGILKKPIRLAQLRQLLELWCDVSVPGDSLDTREPVNVLLASGAITSSLMDDARLLRMALIERNIDSALHYVHRIKGAAQTLGRTQLASIADRIETRLMAKIQNVFMFSLAAKLSTDMIVLLKASCSKQEQQNWVESQ